MGVYGHDPEALTRYPLAATVTGHADPLSHPPGRQDRVPAMVLAEPVTPTSDTLSIVATSVIEADRRY